MDVSFFHGFPYADVACNSASIVVVSENGAADHAKHLAEYVSSLKHELLDQELLDTKEAVDRAVELAEPGRFVVINESSDNPGCGAPGDGNSSVAGISGT